MDGKEGRSQLITKRIVIILKRTSSALLVQENQLTVRLVTAGREMMTVFGINVFPVPVRVRECLECVDEVQVWRTQ